MFLVVGPFVIGPSFSLFVLLLCTAGAVGKAACFGLAFAFAVGLPSLFFLTFFLDDLQLLVFGTNRREKTPPWSIRIVVIDEKIVNISRERKCGPKAVVHHIDEVQQFEPLGWVSEALGAYVSSLIVCVGMSHFADCEVLRTLCDEGCVTAMSTRQVHELLRVT